MVSRIGDRRDMLWAFRLLAFGKILVWVGFDGRTCWRNVWLMTAVSEIIIIIDQMSAFFTILLRSSLYFILLLSSIPLPARMGTIYEMQTG
jgi:hypothetical protein